MGLGSIAKFLTTNQITAQFFKVGEMRSFKFQIQQRLEIEKQKLEELEADHLETGRSMKDLPVDKDEQSVLMQKYTREQQELEHQQHVLDDLEFQMFEVNVSVVKLFMFFWNRNNIPAVKNQTDVSKRSGCIVVYRQNSTLASKSRCR